MQAQIMQRSRASTLCAYRGSPQQRLCVTRPSSRQAQVAHSSQIASVRVQKALVSCRASSAPESYASKASLDLDDVLDTVNLDECPHGFVEGVWGPAAGSVLDLVFAMSPSLH
jgi:hypothetical protein